MWTVSRGALELATIVEEAGGRVTDTLGRPLDFSRGAKLAADVTGIVASNGESHADILRALRGAAQSEIVSGWWDDEAGGGSSNGSAASMGHLRTLIQSKRSLCVEIGAGAGDWLVARAAEDPEVAWVAVEPQRDRVHAIWCKLQLRGLANVHICAMGAAEALGHHGSALRPCSVDEIHLRFPYPPPLELSALTAATPPPGVFGSGSFLSDALRTLRVGGKLRMVTNEASWCLFMLAQVAADRDAQCA